jgi:hypothetical protein
MALLVYATEAQLHSSPQAQDWTQSQLKVQGEAELSSVRLDIS